MKKTNNRNQFVGLIVFIGISYFKKDTAKVKLKCRLTMTLVSIDQSNVFFSYYITFTFSGVNKALRIDILDVEFKKFDTQRIA